MKIVLLSGGSGERLWPLSNDSRPKQFLKILSNSSDEWESMVQRVWSQLERASLAEDAYIATGKGQVEMIRSQVGLNVPVIVEPVRRDTFAAIALAATYLYSLEGVRLDEVVAVLPVDPYVNDSFFNSVHMLENIVRLSGADLALIGVKPTYPSQKYGYILPEFNHDIDKPESYLKVSRFVEKPSEDKAKLLLKQHALWNCGVFAFKLHFLIDLLIHKGLPIQYEQMLKRYQQLPKISFDYEVVEKAANVVMIPYDGLWKDLGTWNTLTEEIRVSVMGKGTISDDSVNTHIINELDIPVAVLGLSNVIVSASADGILVSDKKASPRVKEMIHHVVQRPMYEERRWGSYRVLDHKKYPGSHEMLTKRIFITKDQNLRCELHEKRSEVWMIISGTGKMVLNELLYEVKKGDVIQIPSQSKHGIKALEDMEMIEVQLGEELIEKDNIHFSYEWEEMIEHVYVK